MKKSYIEPNTEIIIATGEALMMTGSERDGQGHHTGGMGEGESGTEETNSDGEIEIDAKPFGHYYNVWDD